MTATMMNTTDSRTQGADLRKAAEALTGLMFALAPGVERAELVTRLHAVGQAIRDALEAGGTVADLVESVLVATAPAPPPPPPAWADCLAMTLDQFADTGVSLRIAIPSQGISLWVTGGSPEALVEHGVWRTIIRGLNWMHKELEDAGVPADQRTVAKLVEVLRGRVEEMRR